MIDTEAVHLGNLHASTNVGFKDTQKNLSQVTGTYDGNRSPSETVLKSYMKDVNKKVTTDIKDWFDW